LSGQLAYGITQEDAAFRIRLEPLVHVPAEVPAMNLDGFIPRNAQKPVNVLISLRRVAFPAQINPFGYTLGRLARIALESRIKGKETKGPLVGGLLSD